MIIETERKADINTATSGDNTIIAAPGAGKYLAIDHMNFLPTSAVTIQIKDGTTAYGGPYPLDAKQAYTIENAMHLQGGVIKLSDNAAFVLNLGGAVQVGGFVRYRVVGE